MTLAHKLRTSLASSPLREGPFRLFYFGVIGAALGYTMQTTVSSWLMATLTPSALMVALVQTASTLPSLLFGLIAGSLSDIADRKRVIVVSVVVMVVTVAVLGLAALAGLIGPVSLLVLTFLVGCGFTFFMPAQQSSINELVPRSELPQAIALGAIAFSAARAIGPALAGAIAAWVGSGIALLASAAATVLMLFAVRSWRRSQAPLPGVPERVLSGVFSGLRYAWHSAAMRALIVRNLAFSICASAFWALLPVIARDLLGLGAGGFGMLFGCFGAGAVIGAWSIPRQLKVRSVNTIVTWGVLSWAFAVALVAASSITALALVGAAIAGASWVGVLASLAAATQSAAPAWVRARAVAMYLVTTQACLALGSAVWGALATAAGIREALFASAATIVVLLLLIRRYRVEMGEEADVTPLVHLPELVVATEPKPDDGPVLIQIDYRIAPKDRKGFLLAIRAAEPIRRRSGASNWGVFRDLGDDERFVERYLIASWADYLRQRARLTMADRALLDEVERFQREGVPLGVSRLIGVSAEDAFVEVDDATQRRGA